MIILHRSEIEALIDYPRAISAIEAAYRSVSEEKINLPPVGHIEFPDHGGDCHIKFGHIRGAPSFVIKIATGFPGNADMGLSNGNGLSFIMSAETGEVKALLYDEMVMTDIRTGIGGAIATKRLARANSKKALVVGTGIQTRRQIEAHIAMFGHALAFEVWGRSELKASAIINSFADDAEVIIVDDLEKACRSADIIITTTGATAPIVKKDWVSSGTHITAVGADAPGKQELESGLVARADVLVADLTSQCLDHGEFATPYAEGAFLADKVVELGDALIDATIGRSAESDITIADLTGIAAQDIAIANVVLSSYETANA